MLAHPEFAPLFGPGSQAEVPVVGLVGGRALSGQIDRLVVTADRVLIVDYKTLRPPPESEARGGAALPAPAGELSPPPRSASIPGARCAARCSGPKARG